MTDDTIYKLVIERKEIKRNSKMTRTCFQKESLRMVNCERRIKK
jgi:hypothetical protein